MARRIIKAPPAAATTQQQDLLEGLNPEQREIVRHVGGPILAAAVAGSGKTTALTRRIAHLVLVANVPGARILAVTFSKKAADEMNERLERLAPQSGARVGTMHSLANQFMREEVVGFRQDMVDAKGRYELCVKDAVSSRRLVNARGLEVCRSLGWKEADLTYLSGFIGLCKAKCILPGTPDAEAFARAQYQKVPARCRDPRLVCEAYSVAEKLRRDRQLVTFDDMLLTMWGMMSADEGLRERWAARWDFVLQDEAQDENPVQREILAMLAEGHRNYMVVGDTGQALYSFRGSDPTGLLEFGTYWEPKVVLMHRNYRCGRLIADAANRVLAHMPDETRLKDNAGTLLSITAERPDDGVVEVEQHDDTDAEAEAVADKMLALRADGAAWKSMVALYRVNSLSRGLEEALLAREVPFVVVGGTNFYRRKEVAALLAYLSVAAGRATFEEVKRCLNAPFRFLGEAFTSRVRAAGEVTSRREGAPDWASLVREVAASGAVQRRQAASAEEWADLVEDLARAVREGCEAGVASLGASVAAETARERAKPAVLLEKLIREAQTPDGEDFVQWITRDEGSESPENNRLSNIRELVRASERFATVDALLDYVEKQLSPPREEGEQDRVTLMSIHRSKGLEFDSVFLLGANERILPHSKAEDVNEERRLAYVAFTRARHRLVVTCARHVALSSGKVRLEPSRFVAEAGLEVRVVARRGVPVVDAAPAAQAEG